MAIGDELFDCIGLWFYIVLVDDYCLQVNTSLSQHINDLTCTLDDHYLLEGKMKSYFINR